MDISREERIRRLAYEIWEQEGRPNGRDQEHWRRAEAEILQREQRGMAPISPLLRPTSGILPASEKPAPRKIRKR